MFSQVVCRFQNVPLLQDTLVAMKIGGARVALVAIASVAFALSFATVALAAATVQVSPGSGPPHQVFSATYNTGPSCSIATVDFWWDGYRNYPGNQPDAQALGTAPLDPQTCTATAQGLYPQTGQVACGAHQVYAFIDAGGQNAEVSQPPATYTINCPTPPPSPQPTVAPSPRPSPAPSPTPSPSASASPTPAPHASPTAAPAVLVSPQPPPPGAASARISPPTPPPAAGTFPVALAAAALVVLAVGAGVAALRPGFLGVRRSFAVAAGLVIVGAGLGGTALVRFQAHVPPPCDRRPATWPASQVVLLPSAKYSTLQQAIDDSPDRTTIRLGAGSYIGQLVVEGKRIRISGNAGSSAAILTAAKGQAVVTFAGCGGGELDDLTIRDGGFGVAGSYRDRVRPGSLTMRNVRLESNGTGVAGTFFSLVVAGGAAHDSVTDGFNVNTGSAMFSNVEVTRSGGAGIRVFDNDTSAGGDVHLANMTVHDAARGGIWVYSHATPITIEHCDCQHNGYAGISLESADGAMISTSSMVNTTKVDEHYGVGLMVSASTGVKVSDSTLSYNALSGVWLVGCEEGAGGASVDLTNNIMGYEPFALVVAPQPTCSTPYGPQANETGSSCPPATCHFESTELVPLKPPPG
ncbi:MAG: hypothetical protein QOK05_577 [Chloroflexota bacterium]|jgi:outer membrane biosynthesis protein TonB|nr:hypothetical protein [Chloroflexota bacterium]